MLYTFCWGVAFSRVNERWLPVFSRKLDLDFEEESSAIQAAQREGTDILYTETQEGDKKMARLVFIRGECTERAKQRIEEDLTCIINLGI